MKNLFETKRLCYFFLLALLLTENTQAEEVSSVSRYQNRFELSLSLGEIELESDTNLDINTRQFQASYNIEFNAGYYFGLTYMAGENGGSLDTANFLSDDELEYQTFAFKSGYQYQSTNKQILYAELMLLDSSVKYLSGAIKITKDELGWGIGSGWRYKLSDSIDVNIGIQYLALNSDLKALNTGISLGYIF